MATTGVKPLLRCRMDLVTGEETLVKTIAEVEGEEETQATRATLPGTTISRTATKEATTTTPMVVSTSTRVGGAAWGAPVAAALAATTTSEGGLGAMGAAEACVG